MGNFNLIIDKIADKINALTSIKAVYSGSPIVIDKYPCVLIEVTNMRSNFKTIGGYNERLYSFTISAINKIENGINDQRILRDIADELNNLFEKKENLNLDGLVNFVNPVEGSFRYEVREAPIMIYELKFTASFIFNR